MERQHQPIPLTMLLLTAMAATSTGAEPAWVGVEAVSRVTVKGTTLSPKTRPGTRESGSSPLVILAVTLVPEEDGTDNVSYDIRYIGLQQGEHDLRSHLAFSEGVNRQMLPPMPVTIADPLPAEHNGQLETPPVSSQEFRAPGVSRSLIAAIGGVWAMGLMAVLLYQWKRSRAGHVLVPPGDAEDELPGKLRLAEIKRLTPQGQAEIEREFLARWRTELGLDRFPWSELIQRLEADDRGRELLAALSEWQRQLEQGPARLPPVLASYAQTPAKN